MAFAHRRIEQRLRGGVGPRHAHGAFGEHVGKHVVELRRLERFRREGGEPRPLTSRARGRDSDMILSSFRVAQPWASLAGEKQVFIPTF
jgi:hypothetical protein